MTKAREALERVRKKMLKRRPEGNWNSMMNESDRAKDNLVDLIDDLFDDEISRLEDEETCDQTR